MAVEVEEGIAEVEAEAEVEVGAEVGRQAVLLPATPRLDLKRKNARKRIKSMSSKCLPFQVFEHGGLLFGTKLLVPAVIHNEVSLGSWRWRPLG